MNRLWCGIGGSAWLVLFLAAAQVLSGVTRADLDELPEETAASRSSRLEARGGLVPPFAPDTLLQYIGTATCQACHSSESAAFAQTRRGELLLGHPRTAQERLGCESCHGPGSGHLAVGGAERTPGFLYFDRNDPNPVEVRNAACLQCHQGGDHMNWPGSAHERRDVGCTDCHQVMSDVSPRAQLRQATVPATCASCHVEQVRRQEMSLARMPMAEGKMDCATCHNPHGGQGEALLAASSVNETCTACHVDKRGPFLWEHAPATESCVSCHDPHGGQNTHMLAAPMPRLCQQCHVASGHPSEPQTPASRFVLGRQCANCHVAVHGSNHPSGMWFLR